MSLEPGGGRGAEGTFHTHAELAQQIRGAVERVSQAMERGSFVPDAEPMARGGIVVRVPNQPKTPLRTFRIPDDVYKAAQQKAADKGETVTDVVKRALERYVKAK